MHLLVKTTEKQKQSLTIGIISSLQNCIWENCSEHLRLSTYDTENSSLSKGEGFAVAPKAFPVEGIIWKIKAGIWRLPHGQMRSHESTRIL